MNAEKTENSRAYKIEFFSAFICENLRPIAFSFPGFGDFFFDSG